MKINKRIPKGIKIFFLVAFVFISGVIFIFNYNSTVTKNLDSYECELPFKKGQQYKIVQGYGGLFTHKNIAALDFEMPAGTLVCAARGGIVYSFQDDYNEGGISSTYKRKANYIIIQHSDGSFGCYWHLPQNGVLVKSGSVSQGQQIGLSGATGSSSFFC